MLASLTSLRFFAALAVVLYHLPSIRDSTTWSWLHFSQGYVGVTFFFILSGFILSHAYAGRLRRREVGVTDFWIARVARIYPLHLLTTLLAIPLALLAGRHLKYVAAVALSHLTLTHAFVPGIAFELNGPSWSLSVEAFFYLLFPLLILVRTRWLLVLTAVIAVYHLALPSTANLFVFYIFPPARLGDFLLGILLHRWFESHQDVAPHRATVLQAGALLLLTTAYWVSASVPLVVRYDIYYVLPMGALILACAWQQGAVARALSGRTMVLLGEASFALYLIHGLVITAGESVRPAGAIWELVVGAGCLVVAVALSIVLHRGFELPARTATSAALKRFLSRRRIAGAN